jgi:SNF2 family DNA or RNA helicase
MLGLTHDIFVTTFRNTSEDESDGIEDWTEPQNQGNRNPEFFPSVLPTSTIDDSGSETDDQEPIAKVSQPVALVEDEETEDEDEALVPPNKLKKHGQKPDLIARSDQIATGRFRLKRPPFVEADVSSSPSLPSSTSHSVPASINKFLRDYQRDGVQFFYARYCENRGGILGDDMGLGPHPTIHLLHYFSLTSSIHRENHSGHSISNGNHA